MSSPGAATALRSTLISGSQPGRRRCCFIAALLCPGPCTEVASPSGAALGPLGTQEQGCTGEMDAP